MWLDIHTFTVYIILYKNILYACYRYTLPFCVRRNLYVPAFDLSDAFRSFLGAGAALEAMCHLPRTYHEHHGTWHPIFQSSQGQTHLRSRITIESRVVFQCLSDVRTRILHGLSRIYRYILWHLEKDGLQLSAGPSCPCATRPSTWKPWA